MRRTRSARSALAALLGATLAGCPIPQTLPEYPTSGAITPPRIQSDKVTPIDTLILVDSGCAGADTDHIFRLSASLVDENTYEVVEFRWFVDYDPLRSTAKPVATPDDPFLPGPADGITIERVVPPFDFQPYTFDPLTFGSPTETRPGQNYRDGGGLHVVELVVSNNFAPEPAPPASNPRPWRTPLKTTTQTFETQVYRWVFHYVPAGSAGALCQFP
jgi:hypothetical protein